MTVTSRNPADTAESSRPWLTWSNIRGLPWVAILLLCPMVVWGLFGPWLYPHDPTAIDLMNPSKPPAWLEGGDIHYLLGTDTFGRDILARLIEGGRIALIVCTAAVSVAAAIGITAGILAGYFGGWVDNIIMRIVDVKMAMPSLLLTLLIGGALGGGLPTILVAIAVLFWADYARVIRGETLALRQRDFVALARVANCSNWRILFRHIMPHLLATCVVLITLQLGRALVVEASITFLGFGLQPPVSAWGLMIAEGRPLIASAWWIPAFPGLCITLTVLGANLFGDWLRDALDPRLRQL